MLLHCFYLFVYIFEAFIAYMYFSDNYSAKYKPIFQIVIANSIYLIGFIGNYISNNNFIVNCVLFFFINLFYSLISFEINMKNGIFHSSILLAIMFSTEIITESVASVIFHIPIDAYKTNIFILVLLGIICKVLYLIICKIISILFSYKTNKGIVNNKKEFILFLYPIMSTIMLAVFLYASYNFNFSGGLNNICVIVSILALILCCFIFIYNRSIQEQEYELLNLKNEKQKNELNKTFYEMLEKKNEEQRLFVHDMKHHLSAIGVMENIYDIKSYISKIKDNINEFQFIGKTNNKMLDLILSKYSHICKTNNIIFSVDAYTSNLSFIDDNDLVSLFGNLLDNAVEAAIISPNSQIRLSITTEKNFDILNVINTASIPPKQNGNRLITTKKNPKYHGYGIKSIEKTVARYNGICQWNFENSKNEFHFNILFNKNK